LWHALILPLPRPASPIDPSLRAGPPPFGLNKIGHKER
jgi:hypothetical protein